MGYLPLLPGTNIGKRVLLASGLIFTDLGELARVSKESILGLLTLKWLELRRFGLKTCVLQLMLLQDT